MGERCRNRQSLVMRNQVCCLYYYPTVPRQCATRMFFGSTLVSARDQASGWVKEQKPAFRHPNVPCEGISANGMFKKADTSRRCPLPIDGFIEWEDIFGTGKNKQPIAIAMKSDEPFALAGIWESWRNPQTGRGHPHPLRHYVRAERCDDGDAP